MSTKLRNRLAASRFRIPDAAAVPAAPGIPIRRKRNARNGTIVDPQGTRILRSGGAI